MLRFLADENLKGGILRGLRRRQPDVDLVRVQDVGLIGADDPTVVAWAAAQGRILLTHDRTTRPDVAYQRIAMARSTPGVFVIPRRMPVRQAIDEPLLIATCTQPQDWVGRVLYLPL